MDKLDGVGVAFCGGGFKSYAQVAALEDMEKNNIKIAACAGTSAGSVIACLTAAGLSAQEVYNVLIKADKRVVESGLLSNMKRHILGLMMSSGLVPYESMLEHAHITLQDAGISGWEDIKKPLAIPTVDLVSGDLIVFTNCPELFKDPQNRWTCLSGDLDLAHCLVASCGYPLAITPVQYLDHYYIDGGCRMNLPTPLFNRDLVDGVVGVAMQRTMKPLEPSDMGTLNIMMRTVGCGSDQLDKIYAQLCDVFVNIPISGAEAFDAGIGENLIQEARVLLSSNPVDWSPVTTNINNDNTSFIDKIRTWWYSS